MSFKGRIASLLFALIVAGVVLLGLQYLGSHSNELQDAVSTNVQITIQPPGTSAP